MFNQSIGRYIKIMSIVQNLVEKDQYSTKRDILYQFKSIFESQTILDRLINNLARTIGVPRSSLNILTTAKGLISGDLEITLNNGNVIYCNQWKQV